MLASCISLSLGYYGFIWTGGEWRLLLSGFIRAQLFPPVSSAVAYSVQYSLMWSVYAFRLVCAMWMHMCVCLCVCNGEKKLGHVYFTSIKVMSTTKSTFNLRLYISPLYFTAEFASTTASVHVPHLAFMTMYQLTPLSLCTSRPSSRFSPSLPPACSKSLLNLDLLSAVECISPSPPTPLSILDDHRAVVSPWHLLKILSYSATVYILDVLSKYTAVKYRHCAHSSKY